MWHRGTNFAFSIFLMILVGMFPLLLLLAISNSSSAQELPASEPHVSNLPSAEFKQLIQAAFSEAHRGYSVDEILLDDDLQAAFQDACQRLVGQASPEEYNWALLNLRKTGELGARTTKTRELEQAEVEAVLHIAEIAARAVQDRQRASIDRIFAKPEWRAEFDAAARQVAPQADPYLIRRAAFQLRKTRRLRPELITRLADWGREITVISVEELRAHPDRAPEQPGIYLFRDASGYLYIGEAADLRKRLGQHLQQSDRRTLASYLQQLPSDSVTIEFHTFAADSRIQELSVRRAYESELIRSRNPRFNIRP